MIMQAVTLMMFKTAVASTSTSLTLETEHTVVMRLMILYDQVIVMIFNNSSSAILLCRRRTERSSDRDWDRNRDRSRDRGYPRDKHGDRGRAVGRRPERDHMPFERDAKGSQNERSRVQRGNARDLDRGRGRDRDSREDGGTQHRVVTGRDEYLVNGCGVLVSPENLQRAKQGRQVKKVKGGWLAAEDSGKCHLIMTMVHTITAQIAANTDFVGSSDERHATSHYQFEAFSSCSNSSACDHL